MSIQKTANRGAKRIPGNLAPLADGGTRPSVGVAPAESRRSAGRKSLMAWEMPVSTGGRMGGGLCRPGPSAGQGKVWVRGVSDPQMDLALFIRARPRRVAHAPLTGPPIAAEPGPALDPHRGPGCRSLQVRNCAGAYAGTNAYHLDSRLIGRNRSWR